MNIEKRNISIEIMVTMLFGFVTVFSNVTLFNLKCIGVMLTVYRLFIPILFIYFFLHYGIQKHYMIQIRKMSVTRFYFITIIIWLVWGGFSLIFMQWSDTIVGIKELVGLVLGTMSVFIVICLCLSDQFNALVSILKLCIIILITIGYIEILSGWHFQSSVVNDPQYIQEIQSYYVGRKIPESVYYIATGIFYNPNDYCAMLCIFTPLFLYDKESKAKKIVAYVSIASVFMILLIDDAWICIISLAMGLMVYLIFSKAHVISYAILFILYLIPRFFGRQIIDLICKGIYKCTGSSIFDHSIYILNVENAFSTQVENATNGNGSMFYRLNTYMEGLKATFFQTKGLGLGPGGFQQYFAERAESYHMIANPHSLWLEILSQYGVIVFALFISALILMFVKIVKLYLSMYDLKSVLILSIGVIFIFACFAPSNFLQNTYYWIPIGMGLGILCQNNDMVSNKAQKHIRI